MKSGIVPRFRAAHIPSILGYAALGAAIAAGYGIIHDQVTYSISPEYFTKMKFHQFHYADFGLPVRVFVAEVGVLATWWVGFIAGWFMARIVVPSLEPDKRFIPMLRGFAIMFAIAFAGSLTGYVDGLYRIRDPNMSNWIAYRGELGIDDLPAFVRVAYIHNASYIGGLAGLVIALIYLWRVTRKLPARSSK
jgi:hypothetical protein